MTANLNSDPNFDGRPAVPFDFGHLGARVPKGCRVFSILGSPVVVPAEHPDKSRIFVHPDDVQTVRDANPNA
jgi:hypothetical protein